MLQVASRIGQPHDNGPSVVGVGRAVDEPAVYESLDRPGRRRRVDAQFRREFRHRASTAVRHDFEGVGLGQIDEFAVEPAAEILCGAPPQFSNRDTEACEQRGVDHDRRF